LTLSTSPYSIVSAFNGGDTQHNYKSFAAYRTLGFSATFNVDNQNADPSAVSRKQLDQWSAKLRLTPDRSTRSQTFEKEWFTNKDLKAFEAEPAAYLKLKILLVKSSTALQKEINGAEDDWSWVATFITENRALSDVELQDKLAKEILQRLSVQMTRSITREPAKLDVADLRAALTEFRTGQQSHIQAAKSFENLAKQFANRFNASVEYINKHQEQMSDYSTVTLLMDKHVSGELIFTVNAGVSLYHRPDNTLHQNTLRQFTAATSLEKTFSSPFMIAKDDKSPISVALSGRYQRVPEYAFQKDKKSDIGTVSLKLEIPIAAAVSLPLSITYANAQDLQELKAEHYVRGNFGLTFDFDKLYTLLHQPK
jgi:hypothetical protein